MPDPRPAPKLSGAATLWAYYRKRPVIVKARGPIDHIEYIHTKEGLMKADFGDYIIEGVQGERYPCKPDIFRETYDPVSPEELPDWTGDGG